MTEVATQGCITISTTNESIIRSTYNGVMQGVSRTNEALTFLQRIDLEKIGLDEKYIEETQAQLHSLLGWFYMRGLDYFGGLPLYKVTITACVPAPQRVKPSTL